MSGRAGGDSRELAAAAAVWVVEHGMEYGAAKRRAARGFGGRVELPSSEQVEAAVREHIALFLADTQPTELRALRRLALAWMQRLAEFRPHLGGAVWRGTATALSAILLDLYCDDPKAAEIWLVNERLDHDSGELPGHGREPVPVLTLALRAAAPLHQGATLHLLLHDADDLRGALRPDAQGRTWRGDAAALRRLLAAEEAAGEGAGGASDAGAGARNGAGEGPGDGSAARNGA